MPDSVIPGSIEERKKEPAEKQKLNVLPLHIATHVTIHDVFTLLLIAIALMLLIW